MTVAVSEEYLDQLRGLVGAWLPAQRWFGGKGREATVDITALADLTAEIPAGDPTPPSVTIWVARVAYADGTVDLYQLPLVVRDAPVDTLEHVLLGTLDTDDAPRWVYDALNDKDVTQAWLIGIRDADETGVVRFHRYVAPEDVPVGTDSLVMTGEQSNTSLLYGDVAIMKVFRRLQPGVNPEIEVHAALADQPMEHVARMFGSFDADLDGGTFALGMLQEFLSTATDGWELAKASVRDLMAEADLHAEEAGGDFAGEAHRLGAAVAEVHAELRAAFGTSIADAAALHARADAMRARLDDAVGVVPELAGLAAGIRAVYDRLDADVDAGTGQAELQRIHGDLHLGQALRTAHRWVVIDFEGEPMADLASRRAPDSALRDVAGMLRSFDYAGHHRIAESGYAPQLAYRANEWSVRNQSAFCDGYAEAAGIDPRATGPLLRAYELDKAVYETVYEARNRPGWLTIPLTSLTRMVESS